MMKKKTKAEIKDALKEGLGDLLGEIVFTFVLMVIGILVLSLFGVDVDVEWVNDDITVLIGLGAIIIPAIIICAIVQAVKKRKKKKIKKIELYKPHDGEEKISDDAERIEQDDV